MRWCFTLSSTLLHFLPTREIIAAIPGQSLLDDEWWILWGELRAALAYLLNSGKIYSCKWIIRGKGKRPEAVLKSSDENELPELRLDLLLPLDTFVWNLLESVSLTIYQTSKQRRKVFLSSFLKNSSPRPGHHSVPFWWSINSSSLSLSPVSKFIVVKGFKKVSTTIYNFADCVEGPGNNLRTSRVVCHIDFVGILFN